MYFVGPTVFLFFLFQVVFALDPWNPQTWQRRAPMEIVRERRTLFSQFGSRYSSPYPKRQSTNCTSPDPANTVTERLQSALVNSGDILSLCPGGNYLILAPINFTAANQEISTVGYPTDTTRATITVNGVVSGGTGHTTAINAQCATCNGVIVRNLQVNGTRNGANPTTGNALLEMGGATSGQLVEYVNAFDPRSWSCLHVDEGGLACTNITIINNYIGPAGSSAYQQWADGITLSCANSRVQGNFIDNPTDGGITIYQSPGSLIENNTVWVETNTMLGGINMVDYDPWSGDYTDTIVQDNLIVGGFATGANQTASSDGDNANDVIIKIGLAIGPRTWYGSEYNNSQNRNGFANNNIFTGAFGYAIAVSSASNFTVLGNSLSGNTSFIGSIGPNCSTAEVPTPQAWVYDSSTTTNSNIPPNFLNQGVETLTCIAPPPGGDYWPYGGQPNPSVDTPGVPNAGEIGTYLPSSSSASSSGGATIALPSSTSSSSNSGSSSSSNNTMPIALGIGIGAAVIIAIIIFLFVRRGCGCGSRRRAVSRAGTDMDLPPEFTSGPGGKDIKERWRNRVHKRSSNDWAMAMDVKDRSAPWAGAPDQEAGPYKRMESPT